MKFTKIILVFMVLLCGVIAMYLLVTSGDSTIVANYNSLAKRTIDSKAAFNKAKHYVTISKDGTVTLNIGADSEEEAEEIADAVDGANPTITPTGDKGIDVAKQVAVLFMKNGKSYYTMDSNPRNGTANGINVSPQRYDCSSYVSTYLAATGLVSPNYNSNSDGFHRNTKNITDSIKSAADLNVGDILWRSGHVAVISKIDGEKIYVADWGSAETGDSIGKAGGNTFANGYAYTFDVNGFNPKNIGKSFKEIHRV